VLEHARVDTLVELAKESYRAALRLNPDNWDARYNLEYAFRITPPPKERAKSDFQGSKSSVFATMPSLPGGGP
jgi:mxaK protein